MAEGIEAITQAFPLVIQSFDIIGFAISVIVFGKIASHGTKAGGLLKAATTLGCGLVAYAASKSFSFLIPLPKDGIFKLLSLDSFIAGLMFSIGFFAAFKLMTYDIIRPSIGELERQVKELRWLLLENKVLPALSEETAKLAASARVKGEVIEAKLNKTLWRIIIQNGKRKTEVHVGGISDTVSFVEVIRAENSVLNFLLDQKKAAGVLIITMLLALSFAFFSGFPTVSSQIEELGLNNVLEQLKSETVSDTCKQAVDMVNGKDISKFETYENAGAKQIIESRSASTVTSLRLVSKNQSIVLGTIAANRACIARGQEFCGCFEIVKN